MDGQAHAEQSYWDRQLRIISVKNITLVVFGVVFESAVCMSASVPGWRWD